MGDDKSAQLSAWLAGALIRSFRSDPSVNQRHTSHHEIKNVSRGDFFRIGGLEDDDRPGEGGKNRACVWCSTFHPSPYPPRRVSHFSRSIAALHSTSLPVSTGVASWAKERRSVVPEDWVK